MPSAVLDVGVRPAFSWAPDYAETLGPEVGELAAMAGFAPDPEQQMALDLLFAMKPDRRVSTFMFSIVCARQNLKTGFLKQAALGWLFLTGQNLVVWSAHEFGTAQEAFRDMTILIESTPDLDREVKAIHRANGDEAIELLSGQRLKFKARTKGGGRGLTGDKVVLDEAMFLQPVHMGSLIPTLSARPDPQVVLAGSAGLVDSAVQRSTRDRGRAGGDPSLTYLEWADPDAHKGCATEDCDHRLNAAGCALDDVERWRKANPAIGRRISLDYISSERRALPPDEFARERLGWWDEPAQVMDGLSVQAWSELTGTASPGSPLIFGVDAGPGLASASIVSADRACIELVERRPSTAWLVARCVELRDAWSPAAFAYDPAGPIGTLVPDFTAAGITLTPVEGKDSTRACGSIVARVGEKSFTHRGEDEFAAAVAGARRRAVGDGHKWSRKDSTVDITPLVAATVALWVAGSADTAEPSVFFV